MATGEILETKAGFIVHVHVLLLQRQQKYTTEGLQQVYQSSPVWAQEKQGEKADLLLSKDLDPTSSTSWVSDFSVMLGGFVADQTFSGTWLPVTGLITLSVDRYLERSAHDGVIYSHGGASLHINHAQEHLQIALSSWSASSLFSFEPSLLHIWKAIPTFLCNISFYNNFTTLFNSLHIFASMWTKYI